MIATSHIKLALAAFALAAAPVAFAHGSMKPKHGGIVTMSGETVVELVRNAQGVSVYVTEEDEPLPSASMTAKLVVTAGAAKSEKPLTAGPDNRFDARGLKIPAGAKVAVMLVDKATQARTVANFSIK
jgi:hypothetical protein